MAAIAPDEAYALGQARWPTVKLQRETFIAYAQARRCDQARATELFVACACIEQDPVAIGVFERELVPGARAALTRRGLDRATIDEALQRLRTRLLVAEKQKPPRLTSWDGSGPLSAWVRTVALRMAFDTVDGAAPAHQVDLSSKLAANTASIELVPHRTRAVLAEGLTQAFARLTATDRLALKLQLLENVKVEDIARMQNVSRATMTRRLRALRDRLSADARRYVEQTLGLSPSELDSLARSLVSDLDVNLSALLAPSEEVFGRAP